VLHLVTVLEGLFIHRAFAHDTNLLVDNNGSYGKTFHLHQNSVHNVSKREGKNHDVFGRGL
jgi:hypothetical protein